MAWGELVVAIRPPLITPGARLRSLNGQEHDTPRGGRGAQGERGQGRGGGGQGSEKVKLSGKIF